MHSRYQRVKLELRSTFGRHAIHRGNKARLRALAAAAGTAVRPTRPTQRAPGPSPPPRTRGEVEFCYLAARWPQAAFAPQRLSRARRALRAHGGVVAGLRAVVWRAWLAVDGFPQLTDEAVEAAAARGPAGAGRTGRETPAVCPNMRMKQVYAPDGGWAAAVWRCSVRTLRTRVAGRMTVGRRSHRGPCEEGTAGRRVVASRPPPTAEAPACCPARTLSAPHPALGQAAGAWASAAD